MKLTGSVLLSLDVDVRPMCLFLPPGIHLFSQLF